MANGDVRPLSLGADTLRKGNNTFMVSLEETLRIDFKLESKQKRRNKY